ncbi:MAG: hypothetical protein HQ559_02930 [Lentisphaerae bacterium]|nr:hypothetical protein [Lentisphaerota bacterium]
MTLQERYEKYSKRPSLEALQRVVGDDAVQPENVSNYPEATNPIRLDQAIKDGKRLVRALATG